MTQGREVGNLRIGHVSIDSENRRRLRVTHSYMRLLKGSMVRTAQPSEYAILMKVSVDGMMTGSSRL